MNPPTPPRAVPSSPPGRDAVPAPTSAPVLRSADLFGAHKEILIEHEAQMYRLRQTSLGKLILTK